MSMNDFVSLISNVGFPIVAFLLMYRLATNSIEKLTNAITENTMILKELKILMEKLSHE